MNFSSHPSVAACFRCGQLCEQPALGSGLVPGLEQDNLPICLDCQELYLTDPEAYLSPVHQRQEKAT